MNHYFDIEIFEAGEKTPELYGIDQFNLKQ